MADDKKRAGDIGTASELQQKYGWYAENRQAIHIEVGDVPAALQDLKSGNGDIHGVDIVSRGTMY